MLHLNARLWDATKGKKRGALLYIYGTKIYDSDGEKTMESNDNAFLDSKLLAVKGFALTHQNEGRVPYPLDLDNPMLGGVRVGNQSH